MRKWIVIAAACCMGVALAQSQHKPPEPAKEGLNKSTNFDLRR